MEMGTRITRRDKRSRRDVQRAQRQSNRISFEPPSSASGQGHENERITVGTSLPLELSSNGNDKAFRACWEKDRAISACRSVLGLFQLTRTWNRHRCNIGDGCSLSHGEIDLPVDT